MIFTPPASAPRAHAAKRFNEDNLVAHRRGDDDDDKKGAALRKLKVASNSS